MTQAPLEAIATIVTHEASLDGSCLQRLEDRSATLLMTVANSMLSAGVLG